MNGGKPKENPQHITVICGGDSAERAVSLQSGHHIAHELKRFDYVVDVWQVNGFAEVLQHLPQLNTDVLFIALHGGYGEDGRLQQMCEAMGLAYTGSNAKASLLAMDKYLTKCIWQADGLSVAQGKKLRLSANHKTDSTCPLPLPVMVKPLTEGSSVGMSRVDHADQWLPALKMAQDYGETVLVEQFVCGREFTVAVLDGIALPVIELVTQGAFFDYHAKYESNDTQLLCPAPIDADLTTQLQTLALAAFDAMGASGWGRVDFMVDGKQTPYLIELNTVPGLTDHSLFPCAARQSDERHGWVEKIVTHAWHRGV